MPEQLDNVVVVLPGIMGSVLRDAHGDDVWELSAGSILKGVFGRLRGLKALQLPEGIGDDHPGDGVTAPALMPDMHVVPGIWTVTIGYDRLDRWFKDTFDIVEADPKHPDARPVHPDRPVNYVRFPYDWRLSNRYNAKQLRQAVEPVLERFRSVRGHGDAKLVFVGHSMGGLVARYYTDVLGGHEITAKVITLGTPHRGAVNALDSLVNGVRKGIGPIGLDLTALARSLPALHQLLPEYACIESANGLLKTTETTLPDLDTAMVADAMRFHDELRDGAAANAQHYAAHPILARTQPTATTARIVDGKIESIRTIRNDQGHDEDQKGDGTVPRLSAAPYGVVGDSPTIRYVMDKHGALPKNEAALVELGGVLTGSEWRPRAVPFPIGVACAEDVLVAGEALDATIEHEQGRALTAMVVGAAAAGTKLQRVEQPVPLTDHGDGNAVARVAGLAAGCYEFRVRATAPAEATVVTPFVVLDPNA
jgi:alpha-beta hydrolase superfamily lysophospholipase